MEEIKEEVTALKDSIEILSDKIKYQQLEIERLTKIINHVNMIRVCEILKEHY